MAALHGQAKAWAWFSRRAGMFQYGLTSINIIAGTNSSICSQELHKSKLQWKYGWKWIKSIIIMILKRRNQFRKQIRRKQIDEILREKRENLIEAFKREEGGSAIEQLFKKEEIAELIDEIEKCSSAMKDEEQLRKIMVALRQMLEKNSQHAIVLLKQCELTSSLSHIAKDKTLEERSVCELLQLLSLYFTALSECSNQKSSQIEGITILGMQADENQSFVKLCIRVINSKMESACLLAICTLTAIFDKNKYLISLEYSSFMKNLISLASQAHIHIKRKAVQLICDMLSEQLQLGNTLLDKNLLADFLFDFLIEISRAVDRNTEDYSYIVCCILCNLTLCDNYKGLALFLKHKVWIFSIDHLHPSSPLFPLVGIFQHYFQKQEDQGLIEEYLFKISAIDIRHLKERQADSIMKTLKRLYANSQSKGQGWKMRHHLQKHSLLYLLEDVQMQEELNSI